MTVEKLGNVLVLPKRTEILYAVAEDQNENLIRAKNFRTLAEAAFFRKAATDYVVAIENGEPRSLTPKEEAEYQKLVSAFPLKFIC